jgi:glycerol-3-phosphate acyltransferase PlsY
MLPVLLLPARINSSNPQLWAMAFGVAAVLGHVRPIFLLGKGGGKGVATAGGVFLGLAPLPTFIAAMMFAVVLGITRISSVSSLSAAITLPIALLVRDGPKSPLFLVSLAVMLLVIWTHRSNIARLRRGEEPRIGRKAEVVTR